MPKVSIELSADLIDKLNQAANAQHVDVEQFLQALVQREVKHVSRTWPAGYFDEVLGGWRGVLERPEQLPVETRDGLQLADVRQKSP
jgi:hypothetical protein